MVARGCERLCSRNYTSEQALREVIICITCVTALTTLLVWSAAAARAASAVEFVTEMEMLICGPAVQLAFNVKASRKDCKVYVSALPKVLRLGEAAAGRTCRGDISSSLYHAPSSDRQYARDTCSSSAVYQACTDRDAGHLPVREQASHMRLGACRDWRRPGRGSGGCGLQVSPELQFG